MCVSINYSLLKRDRFEVLDQTGELFGITRQKVTTRIQDSHEVVQNRYRPCDIKIDRDVAAED
jgi:hypothetical protein